MTARVSILVLLLSLSLSPGCRERAGGGWAEGPHSDASQYPPKQNAELSRILSSPSISPRQLEEYTNQRDENENEFVDFKPIWRRLQIPRDQEGRFDGFDPASSRWRAELIDTSEPDMRALKAIVKISADGGADRRYLVFAKDEAGERWRFSGNIDFTDNYEASEATRYHRVVSDSKHVWLALRTAPRIGTGISASDERWSLIDKEPPREVLKYPLEGGRVTGALSDVQYKASIMEPTFLAGRLTQTVRYKVSFGVAAKPKFHWLFAKTAQVNFVWDENGDKFVLDGPTSNVSAEEVDTIFGADEEKFIEYNLRELILLARGASAEQRKWLKRVIDKIHDGSQRAALGQALRQ
jgi:hypothetical protein